MNYHFVSEAENGGYFSFSALTSNASGGIECKSNWNDATQALWGHMRLLTMVSLAALVGCSPSGGDGKSSCDSPLVGSWKSTDGDVLNLHSNLSFELNGGDGCQSGGSGSCPGQITDGTVKLSIEYSSGGTCLPAGDYVCSFDMPNNSTLNQNCGFGTLTFYKQ